MPVGDIIETAMCIYNQTQNELNVLHWRLQSITGAELTAQQKADQLSTQWATAICPLLNTNASFKGLKYRLLAPVPTAVIISVAGAAAGTRAGDSLPSQVAGVLSLRSSVAPPRVRGRMYMPTAVEGDNDATGRPSAGYQAALATFGTILKSPWTLVVGGNNVTLQLVIWRRPPVSQFFGVDQVLVRPDWGTQRRRSRINRTDISAI